jgi:hypothetical protein
MKFQASGFSIDLPPDVHDGTSYCFSFPELGEMPPNMTIQFELGDGVDMAARREEVLERVLGSYPNVDIRVQDEVRSRADWEYFTVVAEFGEDNLRVCQKQLHLSIAAPKPTVYVFSGTDDAGNFTTFEPFFDAVVRSFQPDDVQRIN